VSIISSRRGGTKHVNHAGASGKETCVGGVVSHLRKGRRVISMRVSHRRQRETVYIGARLPFT
jgi:hypothetical protein